MRKRRQALSDQDRADWALFARLVRPLAGRAAGPVAVVPPVAVPEAAPVLVSAPIPVVVAKRPAIRSAVPAVLIDVRPIGLDSGSWKRFTDGKIKAQAKLDLHGSYANQACDRLLHFIQQSHAAGLRCVEIVTGLGQGAGGVIRQEMPHWLNRPDVGPLLLAAAHSHARNHGAVRLLLRRRG